MDFFIPILLATGRRERQSKIVADFVFKQVKNSGFETELVDVKDYVTDKTIPPWQDQSNIRTWRDIMKAADGLIIVSPEYNHGYPGEFKLVFDQLLEEYNRKPVAICGVSSNSFGGVRVTEILKLVSIEVGLVPISQSVNFAKVKELFDEQGDIKEQKYYEVTAKMLKELEWFARVLKTGRNS